MMNCHMQVVSITTNIKVKIHFILPGLSATKQLTWNFHVDDSTRGRYDMILCKDLLIELRLNLKSFYHIIASYDGTFKGSLKTIIDLGMYEFNDLNTGNITTEEILLNIYSEEIHKSEKSHTSNKGLGVIIDAG